MKNQRIQIAINNLDYLANNQLYTLMSNKKIRRCDYEELVKIIEYTKDHLMAALKE